MTVLGDWASKKVIKLKRGPQGGLLSYMADILTEGAGHHLSESFQQGSRDYCYPHITGEKTETKKLGRELKIMKLVRCRARVFWTPDSLLLLT